jgi:nicotinamidase-related amidase
MGFPVAFVRWMSRAPFFNAVAPFSRWIEGFEPTGGDMVFERDRPSCFASSSFAEVMGASGSIVMAGFAGETACLSTMIDGFHRGKRITYLTDASASHPLEDMGGAEVHELIGKLAGIYGEIRTTADWACSSGQALLNAGWLNG